jgi:hypothetical protein
LIFLLFSSFFSVIQLGYHVVLLPLSFFVCKNLKQWNLVQSFIDFFFMWASFMPSHLNPCILCCFPNFSQWFFFILLSCSPLLFFVCRNLERQTSNFRILLFIDVLFKWARFTPHTFTP